MFQILCVSQKVRTLTLFQPWGADSAHPLLVAPPMFYTFQHHWTTTYVKGDILAASALYGALRHWGTILAYRTTGPVEDLKIWKGVYQRPKHSAEAKGFHYLDISFGCRSY